VIFVLGALLGFRFTNWLVAFIYQIAAVWLGLLNFFFCAACLAWIIDFALRFVLPGNDHLRARPAIAGVLFIAAVGTGIYGIVNARVIRIRRVPVKLETLPDSWRGRTALVMSDLHLGNINGVRFARRITEMAKQLNPDVIFIPGDLFDGTKAGPEKIAAPLFELAPPFWRFLRVGQSRGIRRRHGTMLSRSSTPDFMCSTTNGSPSMVCRSSACLTRFRIIPSGSATFL